MALPQVMTTILGVIGTAALMLTVGCGPMSLPDPVIPELATNVSALEFAANDDYLRRHEAPDFRVLAPFYTHQSSPASCSAASAAMLVNALRVIAGSGRAIAGSGPVRPLTEEDVVAASGEPEWKRAVAPTGDGVSFSSYLHYLRRALDAFGFASAEIEVFRPSDSSPETRRRLLAMLAGSEGSHRDILLAVFDQGSLLAGEHVGHISPVAAYDAERGQVLVLDVDRDVGAPYWTGIDRLLESLLYPDVTDPSGDGLVRIHLPG
jgi:Phytochelatin synthase